MLTSTSCHNDRNLRKCVLSTVQGGFPFFFFFFSSFLDFTSGFVTALPGPDRRKRPPSTCLQLFFSGQTETSWALDQ